MDLARTFARLSAAAANNGTKIFASLAALQISRSVASASSTMNELVSIARLKETCKQLSNSKSKCLEFAKVENSSPMQRRPFFASDDRRESANEATFATIFRSRELPLEPRSKRGE
jgi:hypothetical protein